MFGALNIHLPFIVITIVIISFIAANMPALFFDATIPRSTVSVEMQTDVNAHSAWMSERECK